MTIKTPRFLREFANYQIRRIKDVCPLIPDEMADDIRLYINSHVRVCELGIETVEEAMIFIGRRLTNLNEYGNIIPPRKDSTRRV